MWRISWRSLTKAVANLCTVLQTTEVSKLLLLKPLLLLLLLRISAENSPVKLSRFTRYFLIIACDLKERYSLELGEPYVITELTFIQVAKTKLLTCVQIKGISTKYRSAKGQKTKIATQNFLYLSVYNLIL